MTDHNELKMHHEARRIRDKETISSILSRCSVATVSLHDEPYPYAVAMNYGFEWEDAPVFYFHMAVDGHRLRLLEKDPHVALNICEFLDRRGYAAYRNENHDYRSVHAFGTAEIITGKQEAEFLHGMNVLLRNNGRPPMKRVTDDLKKSMLIMKVPADCITAKAQYPLEGAEEAVMPENTKRA